MADINVIINNIDSKVRATVLTGLNVSLTGDITATDTVLIAFGRLQYQLNNINLSGYVPYTGATQDVNLGIYSLSATGATLSGLTASRLVATNGSKALESLTGTGLIRVNSGAITYETAQYITLTTLSSTATGLTYDNLTGVFSLTAGYVIPTTTEQTNWDAAYTNRITSLTVTGNSGASSLITNTLNIPTYTLAGLGNTASTIGAQQTFTAEPIFSAMTSGSVLFTGASGLLSQDNGKFRYLPTGYNSNAMLMVNATAGSPTPNATLHVQGSSAGSENLVDFMNSGGTSMIQVRNNSFIQVNNGMTFTVPASNGTINFDVANGSRAVNFTGNTTGVGATGFAKVNISGGVANTSGTGDIAMFGITGTINQTTPVSGIIRGILHNPVLTSAYNYKAFTFTHTAAYSPNAAITTYNFGEILPNINASVNSQVINGLTIGLTGSDGAFTGVVRNALTLTGGSLTLAAGTTLVAPLKFTSGTNLTTAINGAIEYNGTNFFATRTGAVREGILTQSAVTTEVLVSDTSVTVNINGTTYKLLARA